MPTIFTLRVHKATAGRDFPFDRVYLCTLDAQPLIERLFRYALVLPVQGPLKAMMENLIVAEYAEVHADKYKAEVKPVDAPLLHLLENNSDVLCIVPMRGKVYKEEILPNYVTHRAWLYNHWSTGRRASRRQKHLAESPFTTYSYLVTPKEKIQPICVACPNLINHENGDCELGDEICMENLPLGLSAPHHNAERIPEGENVLEKDWLPPPSKKV